MLRAYLKRFSHSMTTSLEGAISRIDHNAVIKDLSGRADLSGSYLLMIVCSCLVALFGLLTNSVAVVIGAMLISPLMGPIFTAALAFSMGDLRLARKTLKIIVVSMLLSVLVTAFFTFLSPLKAPTQEIISRTHPNIYDLLIAAFAGAAGAYALCTRVNYLFVTTGVAVATAVIPPLSVVGYGIGTGQPDISLGGFLLFFTNLVAIVISSDIVFHFFRFRASMVEEARYPVRRRVLILGGVLALISVPLVYTLVEDIRKVKLTNRIERVLKRHLDKKDHSHMTDFSFRQGSHGVSVAATVNTVGYYDVTTEKRIEEDLKTGLNSSVQLDLEQVIVRSGRVEPQLPPSRLPPVALPLQQAENLAVLREKVMGRVKEGCEEVRAFIKPYPITQCGIRFSDHETPATVIMTIGRDYPFSDEEQRWLRVALEKKLDGPLALELGTVPLLPPITFGGDGQLDDASLRALATLKQFNQKGHTPHFVITTPRTRNEKSSKDIRDFETIKNYLVTEFGFPVADIRHETDHGTGIRLKIMPEQDVTRD